MPKGVYQHKRRDLREKFEAKVVRALPKAGQKIGCLEWKGGRCKGDYGTMNVSELRKTPLQATHVAWYLAYGVLPTKCLLHVCDNPPCCEVTHLFEGTRADNCRDRTAKGRTAHGEAHYRTKLPDATVQSIRRSKDSVAALARRHRVHESTISRIRSNKRRCHA